MSNQYVIHTVKKGETLWEISQKYSVEVEEIKELNALNSNTIQIGQELKIKEKQPITHKNSALAKKIIIDIGHGEDTWDRSGGKGIIVENKAYEEHHFNAKVGIELKRILDANGFITKYSQPPLHKEVPLQQRTNEANSWGADLFWSIHANAGPPSAQGRCAFYWHSASEAKKLAEIFADEMKKAGFKLHGNGTHASKPNSWTNLHIVRETTMTAVLTENGFMTHPEDFKLIFKSDSYPKEIAKIHAKSIARFYNISLSDSDDSKPLLYHVRQSWKNINSEIGTYQNLDHAKEVVNKYKGYNIYDPNGGLVYSPEQNHQSHEQEIKELKNEISRLKDLTKQITEERNRFKQALLDIDHRISDEL